MSGGSVSKHCGAEPGELLVVQQRTCLQSSGDRKSDLRQCLTSACSISETFRSGHEAFYPLSTVTIRHVIPSSFWRRKALCLGSIHLALSRQVGRSHQLPVSNMPSRVSSTDNW